MRDILTLPHCFEQDILQPVHDVQPPVPAAFSTVNRYFATCIFEYTRSLSSCLSTWFVELQAALVLDGSLPQTFQQISVVFERLYHLVWLYKLRL